MATFTGTTGDDSILGTGAGDDFHLEQGGSDTASGGAGIDIFYMGAAFSAGDRIDGGQGADIVVLDGDYAAGLTLTKGMLDHVETVTFAAGHSYRLDGLAAVGAYVTFDGSALGAGDALSLDASGGGHGVSMLGGAGDDRLVASFGILDGGIGDDTLIGGAVGDQLIAGGGRDSLVGGGGDDHLIFNGDFTKADRVDGGDGSDRLELNGGQAKAVVLGANSITGVETILVAGGAYDLTLNDHNLAAGQTLTVQFGLGGQLRFDGSAETDGRFDITGAILSDTLTGGAGDDTIRGGGGGDTLIGGAGDDKLFSSSGDSKFVGGLGADSLLGSKTGVDRFFFLDVADSTVAAPDQINALRDNDVIWLQPIDADTTVNGNQAFHLVSALDGHAGELALSYDSLRNVTTVSGDVDGDGTADLVILLNGDHTGFTGFQL